MINKHLMNLFHSENCKLCDHSCWFVEKAIAVCKLEETEEELRKIKEETSLVRPDQESVINGL